MADNGQLMMISLVLEGLESHSTVPERGMELIAWEKPGLWLQNRQQQLQVNLCWKVAPVYEGSVPTRLGALEGNVKIVRVVFQCENRASRKKLKPSKH